MSVKKNFFILILVTSMILNVVLIYQNKQQNNQANPHFNSYIKVLDFIRGNLNELSSDGSNLNEELMLSTKGMLKTLYVLYPEVINTPEALLYHTYIFDLYNAGEYNKIKIQIGEILKILEPIYTSNDVKTDNKKIVEKLNTYYKKNAIKPTKISKE